MSDERAVSYKAKGKCCEHIVLMIVACGGGNKQKKIYNWRQMDSLSCSQRRCRCGKCVAEARSDSTAGCCEPGMEGQQSCSENCTSSVLHIGNASARRDRVGMDCLKPLSAKVCN